MSVPATGVTFVVPVLNGGRWLGAALASIGAQRDGRPFEVIAVDDGSTDGSLRLLKKLERGGILRLLDGAGRGAAAAINAGVREASHPIICQVDQDVILQRGWLVELLRAFDDPDVAAAQGHYLTRPDAGFWARAMGRDLEHRYSRIRGPFVRARSIRCHCSTNGSDTDTTTISATASMRTATGSCSAALPSACIAGAKASPDIFASSSVWGTAVWT